MIKVGWLSILILSVVLALTSALISGFTPTQKKYIYIPFGFFLLFFIFMLLGYLTK